jgi:uncharacterized protein YybS (DUF2232 family)
MNFIDMIFFVMGLSLIFNYLDYKKVKNKGLKVLIVVLSFLLSSFIVLMGVADTYIGIRRIFRRESEIK